MHKSTAPDLGTDYLQTINEIFPNYRNQAALEHHIHTFNAIYSLLSKAELFSPLSGRFHKITRTFFINIDNIPYIIYEDVDSSFHIFGTIYNQYIGYYINDQLKLGYQNKQVLLGYEVNESRLSQAITRLNTWRQALVHKFMSHFPCNLPPALLFGTIPNLGHHIWNEQCGIDILDKFKLMPQIKSLIIGDYDYLDAKSLLLSKYRLQPSEFRFLRRQNINFYNGIVIRFPSLVFLNVSRNRILRCISQTTSLQNNTICLPLCNATPVIAFQIRRHNRRWISEIESIASIIQSIYCDHPSAAFIIDGFSRTPTGIDCDLIKSDIEAYDAIVKLLPKNIPVVRSIGLTIADKIHILKFADLVITPIGSGGVIANWLLGKPLITYGLQHYYEWTKMDSETLVEPPTAPIHYVSASMISATNGNDYDFDWHEITKIVENQLKPIN